MLYTAIPKETYNADLRIKQYQSYLDNEKRLYIANQIVKQKVKSSIGLINRLSRFYDIDSVTVKNEINNYDSDSLNTIMMFEGRIASAYWSYLSKVFNEIAKDFRFETRKNLSYSWNMNASDEVNALFNYGYAVLESNVRKRINEIGFDPSIGFLHEITPSKHPLVYDLQELFRYVIDYSVIELLEAKLKKSDFIITENYHTRLKPETAKRLIEKVKENFNRRYEFKGKQYTLDNILYENVRILSSYLIGKSKTLDFQIPEIRIERADNKDVRSRIMSIDPQKRKELGINKSTLWYQQKKIKEGNILKVYNKTRVKIK
jgi:CRISPR-associated protein Cas1